MLLLLLFLAELSVALATDALCGFIGATNIESIYSKWSCFPNGTTQSNPCRWVGVKCTGNLVDSISLAFENLSGTLSSSLSDLSVIDSLHLNSNLLSGTLPSSWGDMNSLYYLSLDDNSLSGTLPSSWGDMSSLNSLFLNGNSLSGTLPSSWVDMSLLQSLYLNGTSLSGTLPSSWVNFHFLDELYLSDSLLLGSIPSGFCNSGGIKIDVSNTGINCYSGCLTSSDVFIVGASPQCHDGSIMERFGIIVGITLLVSISFSIAYYRKFALTTTIISLTLSPAFSFFDWFGSNTSSFNYLGVLRCPDLIPLTFAKLIVALLSSLYITKWWRFRDGNQLVQSCSNPTGSCYSFCGDVHINSINITTDDSVEYINQYLQVETVVTPHPDIHDYCIANLRGECAYQYWLIFKLVPIVFHVLGFFLQCLTWWYYKDFVPQQKQYDIVITYCYPDVSDEGGTTEKIDYKEMFRELTKRPIDSIFAVLEAMTIIYVWGELVWPPIYCDSVRPLSLYYYPIIMCLLDLTKFNMYVATRLFSAKKYQRALFSTLNIPMVCNSFWVTFVLAFCFMYNLVYSLYIRMKYAVHYVWVRIRGKAENSWPTAEVQMNPMVHANDKEANSL